jgi:hypothetical protein
MLPASGAARDGHIKSSYDAKRIWRDTACDNRSSTIQSSNQLAPTAACHPEFILHLGVCQGIGENGSSIQATSPPNVWALAFEHVGTNGVLPEWHSFAKEPILQQRHGFHSRGTRGIRSPWSAPTKYPNTGGAAGARLWAILDEVRPACQEYLYGKYERPECRSLLQSN